MPAPAIYCVREQSKNHPDKVPRLLPSLLFCTDCGGGALIFEGDTEEGSIFTCKHCTPPYGNSVYLRSRP